MAKAVLSPLDFDDVIMQLGSLLLTVVTETVFYIFSDPAPVRELVVKRDATSPDSLVIEFQKPIFTIWKFYLIQVEQYGGKSIQITVEDKSQTGPEGCVKLTWTVDYYWSSRCPYLRRKGNPQLRCYMYF